MEEKRVYFFREQREGRNLEPGEERFNIGRLVAEGHIEDNPSDMAVRHYRGKKYKVEFLQVEEDGTI